MVFINLNSQANNKKINRDAVCPFTNVSRNETELAHEIYVNAPHENHIIGKYYGLYAAHVKNKKDRLNSSSGGVLTEVNKNLLNSGYVDGVIAVGPSKNKNKLFEYQACYNSFDLEKLSKSRYYPVEIGKIINQSNRRQ
jgi:coenzyme F420 hydrogenase subunit beta